MNRNLLLALGMILIFIVTIGILFNVMPSPHRPTDYLVMGAIATLLCLLLLYFVLTRTTKRPAGKPDPEA